MGEQVRAAEQEWVTAIFGQDQPRDSDELKQLASHVVKADLHTIPALLRLTENMAPDVKRRFLAAIAKIRNAVDLEKLAEAIANNQLTAAEAAAGIGELTSRFWELEAPLKAGFLAGAAPVINALAQGSVQSSFELINPHAVEYARQAVITLARPFKDEAKDVIREYLEQSLGGQRDAYWTAKRIRDVIGLDANRRARVDSKWEQLLEQDVPEKDLESRIGKYMDALIRERADVIARNEVHKAAARGQLEAWKEAGRQGLINLDEQVKVWRVTLDERLCDECEPLDGLIAEVGAAFCDASGAPILNGFGETMDIPNMHVQCRCHMDLVRKDQLGGYLDRARERHDLYTEEDEG